MQTQSRTITGERFDPSKYQTLDSFKELLDQLVAGGMESPTGIMKEDWSHGSSLPYSRYSRSRMIQTHYLAQSDRLVRETLINNEKFNSLMDTFDVLMEYNYAKDSAIAAEREVTEQKLAEGEIAFMFGGNWDWSVINAYDYTENMGIMPVPQNTEDGTNTKLVGGGSKFFFIDNSDAYL